MKIIESEKEGDIHVAIEKGEETIVIHGNEVR